MHGPGAVQRVKPPWTPPSVPRARGQLGRPLGGPLSGSWVCDLRRGTANEQEALARCFLCSPGAQVRLGGKLPAERGRGMIDGSFRLGPPPGLLSRRTRLEDPGGHETTGVQRQSQEWVKVRSGTPQARRLTLGRDVGPLASVPSSIQGSTSPQTGCCLEGTEGMRGRQVTISLFRGTAGE